MSGNLSNFLENKLLEHSLGKTSWTMPVAVYGALYTVSPTDSTGGTEVSGSGYVRVAVTWNSASAGTITNSATVTFGPATGAWGTALAFGLLDASALGTGNLLWYGPLNAPRTIANTDSLQFLATTITISLD